MSSPSAVADLLAALAYRIQNKNKIFEEELEESTSSMGLAISELNRSLTLDIGGEESGIQVMDAALSLMCFKAPQVSIISILNSGFALFLHMVRYSLLKFLLRYLIRRLSIWCEQLFAHCHLQAIVR